MKKFLAFSFSCLIFLKFSYCQRQYACEMIKQIFANSEMKEHFLLDYVHDKEKPIFLIDINHLLDSCDLTYYKKRKINYLYDSIYLREKNGSYITIHDVVIKDGKFYMVLEYKADGAYGSVEFIKVRRKIKISKINIGYF